jgi:hypothetical protein
MESVKLSKTDQVANLTSLYSIHFTTFFVMQHTIKRYFSSYQSLQAFNFFKPKLISYLIARYHFNSVSTVTNLSYLSQYFQSIPKPNLTFINVCSNLNSSYSVS